MASNNQTSAVGLNVVGDMKNVKLTGCTINVTATTGQGGLTANPGFLEEVGEKLCSVVNTSTRNAICTKIHEPFQLDEPNTAFTPELEEINFYGTVEERFKRSNEKYRKLEELFQNAGKKHSHVSLIGPPGCGKTTLSKRIGLAALDKTLPGFKDIEMVQFLQIGSLNEKKKMTLFDLLFNQPLGSRLDEDMRKYGPEWLRINASKILFILDGLDQRSWKYDATDMADDSEETAETILSNLFRRVLYDGCNILSSARDYCLSDLRKDARPDRIISIGDLEDESADKLITELGGENGVEILNYLKTKCRSLLAYCRSPLILLFATAILKKSLNIPKTSMNYYLNENKRPINTMSELFICIIEYFSKSGHCEDDYLDILAKLKMLSYQFATRRCFFFTIEDIEKHNLSKADVKDFMSVALNEDQDHDRIRDNSLILFFVHQLIQETLAALYLADASNTEFEEGLKMFVDPSRYDEIGKILIGIFCSSATRKRAETLCGRGISGFCNFGEKKQVLRDHLKKMVERIHDDHVFEMLAEVDEKEKKEIKLFFRSIRCRVHPVLFTFGQLKQIEAAFKRFDIKEEEDISKFLRTFRNNVETRIERVIVTQIGDSLDELIDLLSKGKISEFQLGDLVCVATGEILEVLDSIHERHNELELKKIAIYVENHNDEDLSRIVIHLAKLWDELGLHEAYISCHDDFVLLLSRTIVDANVRNAEQPDEVELTIFLTKQASDCIAQVVKSAKNVHLRIPFAETAEQLEILCCALLHHNSKVDHLEICAAYGRSKNTESVDNVESVFSFHSLGKILQGCEVRKFTVSSGFHNYHKITKEHWMHLLSSFNSPKIDAFHTTVLHSDVVSENWIDSEMLIYPARLMAKRKLTLFYIESSGSHAHSFLKIKQDFAWVLDAGFYNLPKSGLFRDAKDVLMTIGADHVNLIIDHYEMKRMRVLQLRPYSNFRQGVTFPDEDTVWDISRYEKLSDLIVTCRVMELFLGEIVLSQEGLKILEVAFRSNKIQMHLIDFSQCLLSDGKAFCAFCLLGCAANARILRSFPCKRIPRLVELPLNGQVHELDATKCDPLRSSSYKNLGLLILTLKLKALKTSDISLEIFPFRDELISVKATAVEFVKHSPLENLPKLLGCLKSIFEIQFEVGGNRIYLETKTEDERRERERLTIKRESKPEQPNPELFCHLLQLVQSKFTKKLTIGHYVYLKEFVEIAHPYFIKQQLQLSALSWKGTFKQALCQTISQSDCEDQIKFCEVAKIAKCKHVSVPCADCLVIYKGDTACECYVNLGKLSSTANLRDRISTLCGSISFVSPGKKLDMWLLPLYCRNYRKFDAKRELLHFAKNVEAVNYLDLVILRPDMGEEYTLLLKQVMKGSKKLKVSSLKCFLENVVLSVYMPHHPIFLPVITEEDEKCMTATPQCLTKLGLDERWSFEKVHGEYKFFKLGKIIGLGKFKHVSLYECDGESLESLNDALERKPIKVADLAVELVVDNPIMVFTNLVEILEKLKVESLAIEEHFSSKLINWTPLHDLFGIDSLEAFAKALKVTHVKLNCLKLDVHDKPMEEERIECFCRLGRIVEMAEISTVQVRGLTIGDAERAEMKKTMDKMRNRFQLV